MQGIDLTPKKYERNRKSIKDLHPDWTFMDWDEEQMTKLAKGTQWEIALSNAHKMIQRADILRCVVLQKYGGVYLDMDMYGIQSLDSFLIIDKVQAGCTSFHKTLMVDIMGGINNGIIFSPQGHPFWEQFFIPELLKRLQLRTLLDDICPAVHIIRTTGPLIWTALASHLHIHKQEYFYSLVVLKKKEVGPVEVELLKEHGAYVYHAQDSVWLNSWEKYLLLAFMGRAWIYTCSILVLLILLRVWFWARKRTVI